MFKNTRNRKGFTLIELMVVMAITGVIMMYGINAFISTRRSKEVTQASANARDAIKNARAMALSVSSPDPDNGWPVAVEVVISGKSVVTRVKYLSSFEQQYSDWDDNNVVVDYNSVDSTTLNLGSVSVSSTSPTCDRVVFSSVNGEMFIYNSSYVSKPSCTITFSSQDKQSNLILNSAEKKFDIQ